MMRDETKLLKVLSLALSSYGDSLSSSQQGAHSRENVEECPKASRRWRRIIHSYDTQTLAWELSPVNLSHLRKR